MSIIIYIGWKYSEYYLQTKQILPFDMDVWWYILSPNGIGFHYSGIIAGTIIALLLFFFNKNKNDIKKIIDMLFFASMWMLMALGLFLVVSDEVIGQPNDGWFAIRALVPYSKIQQYGQVYPYGIIISVIALVSYVCTKMRVRFTWRAGSGYLWFAVFLTLLTFSFSYQLYPKYLVAQALGVNRDIKYYINLILIIICLAEYYKLGSNK